MVVASAATSILSLYVIPAFASSHTEAPAGPLGSPSGHALPDVPVDHVEGDCAESLKVSAAPDASTGKSCNTSTTSHATHDAEKHGAGQPHGTGSKRTAQTGAAGYGDDDTADSVPVRTDGSGTAGTAPAPGHGGGLDGGLPGHGDGTGLDGGLLGHGDGTGLGDGLLGHGDDNGLDGALPGRGDDNGVHVHGTELGYGDTPSTPPTTPPVSPPPTKTPPAKTPPTRPATPPSTPASPPAQSPSLPNTGAGDLTFMASGVAALLTTGGVLLYRRGRTATRR
ncbi:hypothetical protein S1361_14925 [Streptomyces cyanogenus]|uniref:Gram-positive cocci surface proteins LPxTG domain-containing protein n=2 Tax=Streptomyces cyanogenus TaxID=80860 RepID=A0ABX7TS41_STRCY|nr:hypothetical protein S1361_14925 [Streptomyces cyanogenus]